MNYRFTFTVEGVGDFPADMLRYDRCWPATENDSIGINPYVRGQLYRNTRRVKMTGLTEPTIGRWKSFGWAVVGEVEKRRAA